MTEVNKGKGRSLTSAFMDRDQILSLNLIIHKLAIKKKLGFFILHTNLVEQKNHIKTIQPIFATDRNFVSTFQVLTAGFFLIFANVSIPSLAHQPESTSDGLQSLNPHILKNKQTKSYHNYVLRSVKSESP